MQRVLTLTQQAGQTTTAMVRIAGMTLRYETNHDFCLPLNL